jgi:hypothetical protein
VTVRAREEADLAAVERFLAEQRRGRRRDELKPEIPRAGAYGIPLRDELVLKMVL